MCYHDHCKCEMRNQTIHHLESCVCVVVYLATATLMLLLLFSFCTASLSVSFFIHCLSISNWNENTTNARNNGILCDGSKMLSIDVAVLLYVCVCNNLLFNTVSPMMMLWWWWLCCCCCLWLLLIVRILIIMLCDRLQLSVCFLLIVIAFSAWTHNFIHFWNEAASNTQ